MKLVIVGAVLVGCGAPARPVATAPPVPAAPANERAVAEPWKPPAAPEKQHPAGRFNRTRVFLGEDPGTEDVVIVRGRGGPGSFDGLEEHSKRSDLWDPCVRDVLADREPVSRDTLGDALTGYVLTCDRSAHRIAFEPPQSRNSQAPNTVIGLHGVLERGRTEVALRLLYVIARPDPFERVTIIAGPLRWTSPRLDVEHDPAHHEATSIPFAPSLARVVRRMLDEPYASIRFETATSYEEVIVPDQTKQDMRMMLDALNL